MIGMGSYSELSTYKFHIILFLYVPGEDRRCVAFWSYLSDVKGIYNPSQFTSTFNFKPQCNHGPRANHAWPRYLPNHHATTATTAAQEQQTQRTQGPFLVQVAHIVSEWTDINIIIAMGNGKSGIRPTEYIYKYMKCREYREYLQLNWNRTK